MKKTSSVGNTLNYRNYCKAIPSLRSFVGTVSIAFFLGAASPILSQDLEVQYSISNNLRAALIDVSLLNSALKNERTSGSEILAAAKSDYQRFLTRLYEEGYYSAQISITINGKEAASYSPFDSLDNVRSASVRVNEGRIFTFGQASITPLPKNFAVPPEFRTGETARSPVIQEALDDTIEAWRETGRPNPVVTDQQIVADHDAQILNATFTIDPGQTAVFSRLNIVGNERMRSARIQKIAGIKTGSAFDPQEIANAAARLRTTGIFSTVSLREAEQINSDGTIDVTATVVEAKPRRIGAGVSLSTTDGATVEGFWLHRNLLGGGENLRFDASVEGIGGETDGRDIELGLRLARPATLTRDTQAAFYIDYKSQEEPDYDLVQYAVGLDFEHRISQTLRANAGIKFSFTDTDDGFGLREFSLIELPLGLTFDNRDSKLQPTQGYYADFDSQPFYDLDRGSSGMRLYFDGRTYRTLNKTFVLAGRVQLGNVIGPDIANTSPDLLFYSGGGGTVRGQSYQSLGVTNPDEIESGGKSFAALSAELRFPIRDGFGGVVFADYGIVGAKSQIGKNSNSHAGVGVGIRIETGIGPVRVDIAKPDNSSFGLRNLNLYIGIGQTF